MIRCEVQFERKGAHNDVCDIGVAFKELIIVCSAFLSKNVGGDCRKALLKTEVR